MESSRFVRAAWAALAALAVVAVAVYWDELQVTFASVDAARSSIRSMGLLAPVASIVLGALQVLVAPIPGQVLGVANGLVFGPYVGLAVSMAGLTLGSALAMGLSRAFGRPFAEQFVDEDKLARFDARIARHGERFVFLVFLLPFLPDDLLCFAVGVTRLSIPRALVLAFFGRLPGMVVATVLGDRLDHVSYVAVVVGVVVVSVLGYLGMRHAGFFERVATGEDAPPED